MVLRFLTLASIAGVFSVLGSDAAAGEGRRCATPVPTSEQLDESRRVSAVAGERKLPFPKEGVEIPVAFHVILKYDTSGGVLGDLLDKDINKQLRVLNDAYIGTGFRFSLRSVDRTRNNAWFKSCTTQEESTMKDALAIDPARVLNVYTCDPENDDLGLSTFPQGFPESNAMHGVVISFRTLPNGAEDRYNLGITLVHETGHYLGLYHTFESGNYKTVAREMEMGWTIRHTRKRLHSVAKYARIPVWAIPENSLTGIR